MARARRTDPATSHQAAAQVEARGTAASQRVICLLRVQTGPGQTAAEIAEWSGLERHVPSRRLPELRAMGLVRNDDTRLCRITGNRSMTWEPTARKLDQQSLF